MIDDNYFTDYDDSAEYELERYIRRKRKIKFILFGVLGLFFTVLITVSIIAINTTDYEGYEIVIENDFDQNFNDKNVIDKYFPK